MDKDLERKIEQIANDVKEKYSHQWWVYEIAKREIQTLLHGESHETYDIGLSYLINILKI